MSMRIKDVLTVTGLRLRFSELLNLLTLFNLFYGMGFMIYGHRFRIMVWGFMGTLCDYGLWDGYGQNQLWAHSALEFFISNCELIPRELQCSILVFLLG